MHTCGHNLVSKAYLHHLQIFCGSDVAHMRWICGSTEVGRLTLSLNAQKNADVFRPNIYLYLAFSILANTDRKWLPDVALMADYTQPF